MSADHRLRGEAKQVDPGQLRELFASHDRRLILTCLRLAKAIAKGLSETPMTPVGHGTSRISLRDLRKG